MGADGGAGGGENMKQVSVSLWELNKEDIERLANANKDIQILEYTPVFRQYRIVRAKAAARNFIKEYVYLSFEDPTK